MRYEELPYFIVFVTLSMQQTLRTHVVICRYSVGVECLIRKCS